MFKNYFKIYLRNFAKNKAFSVINIAGLTIGMSCTIMILLWVYSEHNWDKAQNNYNTVYHIFSNRNFNGEISTGADMMYPLPKAVKAAFPEVEHAAVVSFGEQTLFAVGDKRLNKQTITTQPDFFGIFNFDFVYGNPSAINDPDAVIITESTAQALFNQTNVIGQAIKVNNNRTAYIKGVVKDVPQNSTLQFDAIIPFNPSSPQVKRDENEWVNCGNRVFIKTNTAANIAALQTKILQLIKEHSPAQNPTTKGSIILHPMSKWRLYEEFKDGKNTGGRIQYVKLFTWIAVIILLIACVNFMNLSTAQSERRAKEVGIRKTLGSGKNSLLLQFLGETLFLSVLSFVFAVIIVFIATPMFGKLLNQTIQIPFNEQVWWLIALGIVLFTGLIAGSYPAFYLTGFRPVKVLKGSFQAGKDALLPRKILVTAQFVFSIVLISATLIVYQQIQYVKNRDIGYDINNLIMVNSSPQTDKSFAAMKNDLLQTGLVANVARTSTPVTNIFGFTSGIKWPNALNKELVIGFFFSDEGIVKTLGAKLIDGREFRQGDADVVIFNKEAIKLMGLKNAVGIQIDWAGRKRTIVGVIDNMVMGSPYEAAAPIMIPYETNWSGQINIRLSSKHSLNKALAQIEAIHKKYSPSFPYEYRFVQDDFNQKFASEQLIGRLAVILAALAIFICCMGLFGLVAFSIEIRYKEIGIRKVLGATVQQVLLLMSADLLKLVALAFLVAIPLAWWGMHEWLQNYTYHVNISIWVFGLVGLALVAITWFTVYLNAIKAAVATPANSLRSE